MTDCMARLNDERRREAVQRQALLRARRIIYALTFVGAQIAVIVSTACWGGQC